jgi:hypothetical protein
VTSSFAKEDRGNLTGVTGSYLIFGWIFVALISSAILTSVCSRISGGGEDAMKGVVLGDQSRAADRLELGVREPTVDFKSRESWKAAGRLIFYQSVLARFHNAEPVNIGLNSSVWK